MSDSRSLRIWGALFTVVVMTVMLVMPLSRPAHAAQPTIVGQNPSTGTPGPGTVISDKDGATDDVYHFVARISDSGGLGAHIPVKQVIIRDQAHPTPGAPNQTLNLTPVGTTDTFQVLWDMQTVPTGAACAQATPCLPVLPGSGTVTFHVQDALGAVDDDVIAVSFQPTRETVEMTSPTNGGGLGFFSDGSPSSRFAATIQGTVSEGLDPDTDSVALSFSTSSAATAPNWASCNTVPSDVTITDNTTGQDTFVGTCLLPAAVSPASVQMIGSRAINSATTALDSGDAHRINPSSQTVSSLTIVPKTDSGPVGTCNTFTVQARDQQGQAVSGVNVDVHMIGATPGDAQDDLQFAINGSAEGEASDPFSSPKLNHSAVTPAAGCDQFVGATQVPEQSNPPEGMPDDNDSDNTSDGSPQLGEPGTQAVDEFPGAPDQMHIEGFTGANGNWRFSIDAEEQGTVSLFAWFDSNGDDLPTNETRSDSAVKTFGQAVPVVDAQPETASNQIGSAHTITATVTQGSVPVSNVAVQFRVTSGPHADNDLDSNATTPAGVFGPCTTNAAGQCSDSYTGVEAGTDTIQVWLDTNNNFNVDAAESSDPGGVQKTWTVAPNVVTASPQTDSNPIGSTHTITATVTAGGAPVTGAIVQFRVTSGPHADNDLDSSASTPAGVFGPCTTTAGQCSDSYVGTETGTDTIQVWIDPNNNFVVDTGESADPDGVQKTWTAAAEAVAASPQTATNNVGQAHTITATVTSGAVAQQGRVVSFRVTNGPHFDNDLDSSASTPGGFFGTCTTGLNGQCINSYVGTEAGDDSRIDVWLDADGDFTVDTGEAAEPGGVEKLWVAPTVTVEASPATATNQVGQSHNVTATVREGGNLAANKLVTFKVTSGPHAGDDLDSSGTTPAGVFGQCTTVASGQCSKSYTGTKTGQDQITVFIDGDADFVPDTGEPSTQVTKTWTSVPVTAIDCVPETDSNQVNTSHTVTATVTGSGSTPVAGATVAFQVRVGPHSDNDLDSNGTTPLGFFGSGTTDGSGHVSKSYSGTETVGNGGNDVIDCWVDANANNQDDGDNMEPDGADADTIVQAAEQTDSGELSDYVDKTWTVAPPPPPQQKCPGASTVPGNHIVGTAGNDTLTGTSGPDVICGLGGNDSINGLGSDDLILGGDGADTIRGGDGDDLIFSQAGNDLVLGNSGDDRISGGSENDRIDGGDDDDRIWGVGGNDTIYGGFGNDRIVGNAGDDRLVGGPGLDTGYGLGGADRLFFRDGIRDFRVDGGTGVDACSRDPSDPVDECP